MTRIITTSLFLAFLFGCSEYASDNLVMEDTLRGEPEININATVENGILCFENSEELFEALIVLDTLPPNRRKAWEDKINFKSIRSLYDDVSDKFYNGEDWNAVDEGELITLIQGTPMIVDYTIDMAPILNRDGVVMVGGALGTHRRDGSYWVRNANYSDLQDLIKTKKTNEDSGHFAFVNPMADESLMYEKSCSGGLPNVLYSQPTVTLTNGESNGSSRLRGTLSFNYTVGPPFASGTALTSSLVKVFFKLRGISERKSRNQWRSDRHDHSFSWNFTVKHIELNITPQGTETLSETETTYSGMETHYNNQEAAKEIWIINDLYLVSWANANRFILEQVMLGTAQTTNYLAPNAINYECN